MRPLIFRLIFPLSVISFISITKWWYVLVVDGPDEILYGFPFPWFCKGWGSSMTWQIFVVEFLIDLLTYFAFWFMLVWLIHRFVKPINLNNTFGLILFWITIAISFSGIIGNAMNRDNHIYLKRAFDYELMDTGISFFSQQPEWPDFYNYHPKGKP